MSNEKIMSPEYADCLNRLVQANVDNVLWLVSNFESTPSVLSIDAKVLQKIQDMYIFTIDVGLCRQVSQLFGAAEHKEVSVILDGICNRRAVMDHCSSIGNGTEADRIWYDNWVAEIIKKENPTTEDDWEVLFQELRKSENRLLELFENFITNMRGKIDKREKVAKRWKEYICDWYCNNAGRQAIIGNWEKIYMAENPKEKIDNVYSKLNNYVEGEVYKEFDQKDKQLAQMEESIRAIKRLSEDAMKNLDKLREKNAEEKCARKNQIVDGLNGKNYSEGRMYAEWYISQVQKRIRDMVEGEMPDQVATLLPQDVVQYICSSFDFSVIYQEKAIKQDVQ